MEVKVYKKSISLGPETLNEEDRSFEAVIMSDAPAYPAIGGSEFPDIWLVDGLSVRASLGVHNPRLASNRCAAAP